MSRACPCRDFPNTATIWPLSLFTWSSRQPRFRMSAPHTESLSQSAIGGAKHPDLRHLLPVWRVGFGSHGEILAVPGDVGKHDGSGVTKTAASGNECRRRPWVGP